LAIITFAQVGIELSGRSSYRLATDYKDKIYLKFCDNLKTGMMWYLISMNCICMPIAQFINHELNTKRLTAIEKTLNDK